MGRTRSFEARTERPERVVSAALAQAAAARRPGLGLLLVTAPLAPHLEAIAQGLAERGSPCPWLLAAAPGVLTERGELEHEPAAVGMVFDGVRARLLESAIPDATFGERLGQNLRERHGASALVLVRGDELDEGWLGELDRRAEARGAPVFGGGTLPGGPLYVVDTEGARPRGACAVVFAGPPIAHVVSSSACRLLSPLAPVTRTRGSMILEIEGAPALSRLGESTQSLEEQPLVLLAIAAGERPLAPEGRSLAVRPIHGVDPSRGGLLLSDEVPLGTRVAFAVRDARASRADFSAHLGALRRGAAGAAPVFGIFVSCAGRGRNLYQASDVDVRLIRESFPGLPLVGLHSPFELAPLEGRLTPQIYTGVLGLYRSPS